MDHPLLLLALTGAGLYLAKLWRDDMRAAQAGRSNRGALPGAAAASTTAVAVGIAGALAIVAIETAGEIALGLSEQQSRITGVFALYSICAAPVIEELIFRGWLVVENRGRAALWAGAIGASLAFALLHPFLWEWQDAGFRLTLTEKGVFSTALMFVASLWFYAVRFGSWNRTRSLLPCFLAHAAKNAGVVAVKASMGFLGPAW